MGPHTRRALLGLGVVLCACGLSLIVGCGTVGGFFDTIGGAVGSVIDAINPFSHAGADADHPGCLKPNNDPTGLAGIFGWWSWACIAFGVLSLLTSFLIKLVPTRASFGALLIGAGLGVAKGWVVKHEWTLYVGFAAGLIVFAWPTVGAWLRLRTAKRTGQPIAGHTGREAIAQLNPFRKGKSNVDVRSLSRRDRSGGVAVSASEPERSGGDGASSA